MSAPVPFPNCWWVTDQLLAGPVFFSGDLTSDVRNLTKLEGAGISTIISLVGLEPYYSDETEAEIFGWAIAPRFIWLGFNIPVGTAPDVETMGIILQWIDAGLLKDKKVYLHSGAGCGRTGAVVGCWLARHEIAVGSAIVDYLADIRAAAGLTSPCPETNSQIDIAIHWRPGK